MSTQESPDIHQNQPILSVGQELTDARAAMIMIHGRGATAESILGLAQELGNPDFAYLAPQAAHNTWYPYSFMSPIERNQPHLSSALTMLGDVITQIEATGISPERIILLGFSQGACLATEFVVRHPRRYGGVVGLSGGLIGPPGTQWNSDGSLEGTPVFLGCSDIDPHIPVERVEESARVMEQMGAVVTKRLYRGMGHTVNYDEIEAVQEMMDRLLEEK